MTDVLRIGIAGLGTVGAGTVQLLTEHADMLAARCGKRLQVTAVSARNKGQDRGVDLSSYAWHDDARALVDDDNVDVVVELIGGSEGIAKELCEAALKAGKPVVTANKALIAHHGFALAQLAEQHNVPLAFEAAVAGCIPVLHSLRTGLAANAFSRIEGILNGTCNYILTVMREEGRDFVDVLKDAQELGYAEADPAFDVDGVDAAHKLAIIASMAYGSPVDFDAVHIEGIREVTASDMRYADQLGYVIKLLGIAAKTEAGVQQRVHPCFVPKDAPIAKVEGVFNAVVAYGDASDQVMLEGRGAGAGPTASSVVSDLIDIARGGGNYPFIVPTSAMAKQNMAAMDDLVSGYYLRLAVEDKPGVMAQVSGVLSDHGISVRDCVQQAGEADAAVDLVMTTHSAQESAMNAALDAIKALAFVTAEPQRIRIETSAEVV